MNENISQFLSAYITNPDPQYAVMLKGKWGCGKTFFVRKWVKEHKKEFNQGELPLEPIYVSLYGLKTTEQITRAIDRIINPMFYSKGAETIKKVLKFAGKVVLKTSFDFNENGKDDVSFDASLDSLNLLTSSNEDMDATKLLVFDDIERCPLEIKTLLGYINNFVEHGSCHVIIIGDETHATKETQDALAEFKEKTVGREFEINPDANAAVDYFLNGDVPLHGKLHAYKDYIIEVFLATQCNNLRLLRQCLYDFNVLLDAVDDNLINSDKGLIMGFLGSYIITYCEYRGNNHTLLKKMNENIQNALEGDDNEKEQFQKLQSKYNAISEKYQINLLNKSFLSSIINEIETGISLKSYVEWLIKESQKEPTHLEKLSKFSAMTNEEFIYHCKALEQDLQKNTIPSAYFVGKSLALLSFFDEKNLYKVAPETITYVKGWLSKQYSEQTDKDNLYLIRSGLRQGLCSYNSSYETKIEKEFTSFVDKKFDEVAKSLPNKMEVALEQLTDDNIHNLIPLSNESTPDHQYAYNMTSIFQHVNSSKLSNNILSLSNENKVVFCDFLSTHYKFLAYLGEGCNRYYGDLTVLQSLKQNLTAETKELKCIDKYVLDRVLKFIDGAISRAEGCNDPIIIY